MKHDAQSIKAERYKRLESKPVWRAMKLVLITVIVLISLPLTNSVWNGVNDCYRRHEAHVEWTPGDAGNFWRGTQPLDCNPQSAIQAGFIVTLLIPVAGMLVYRLCRQTAAYVAYGSEKHAKT